MPSLKRQYRKPLSLVLGLLLVLTASIWFGQVLGKYYIGNMARDEVGKTTSFPYLPVSSREGAGKKKVLRLNKFDYYTIRAGTFSGQEQAVLLGKNLAEKGLPSLVTGSPPYQVLIGFTSNGEKLAPLAASILVDGEEAVVVKGEVNAVSFKFEETDTVAANTVAPYLGEISISLNKGLLLYKGISASDEVLTALRPKFTELARELEGLAGRGRQIAAREKDSPYSRDMLNLAGRCADWARSLTELEAGFQDNRLLASQQKGLALLEDYHRFLGENN